MKLPTREQELIDQWLMDRDEQARKYAQWRRDDRQWTAECERRASDARGVLEAQEATIRRLRAELADLQSRPLLVAVEQRKSIAPGRRTEDVITFTIAVAYGSDDEIRDAVWEAVDQLVGPRR